MPWELTAGQPPQQDVVLGVKRWERFLQGGEDVVGEARLTRALQSTQACLVAK